jgi:hypothetical protein
LVSNCVGWLLHVSIEQDKAILWIKTEDKKVLRLIDFYQPFFYVLTTNEYDGACLFHVLSHQTIVKKVSWEENRSTNMFEKYSKKKLICVFPESLGSYAAILDRLEKDSRVKQTFNTDLSHLQQYLFHRLKIEPTSKVEVEYEDSKLVMINKIKDESDVSPSPFSILHLDVHTLSGRISSDDPVIIIKSRYEDVSDPLQGVEVLFDSKCEKDILEDFAAI